MNRKTLSFISTISLAFIMVLLSVISHEKEIIFPEITALCLGSLVAPKMVWNTSRLRMFFTISLCSVLGVLIVRFIPLSVTYKLIIAFLLSQIILYFSSTSFAPMTSALVLPVLLGTKSFIYPISASVLSLIIALISCLLYKKENNCIEKFFPHKEDYKSTFLSFSPFYKRLIVVALMIAISINFDLKFAVAPPIIVAFIELSNPLHGMRKRPFFTCIFMIFATFTGSLIRFLFSNILGLPLCISIVLALSFLLILVNRLEMYFPPAGAMCTLPFLVPKSMTLILPLQASIGIVLFIIIAKLVFPDKKFN